MIDTRDTTLNQRPKALDAIGVDIAPNIDFGVMVNSLMLVAELSHRIIGGELGGKQGGVRLPYWPNVTSSRFSQ